MVSLPPPFHYHSIIVIYLAREIQGQGLTFKSTLKRKLGFNIFFFKAVSH